MKTGGPCRWCGRSLMGVRALFATRVRGASDGKDAARQVVGTVKDASQALEEDRRNNHPVTFSGKVGRGCGPDNGGEGLQMMAGSAMPVGWTGPATGWRRRGCRSPLPRSTNSRVPATDGPPWSSSWGPGGWRRSRRVRRARAAHAPRCRPPSPLGRECARRHEGLAGATSWRATRRSSCSKASAN